MKRSILVLVGALGVLFSGCSLLDSITGSGFPQSTEYRFTNFSKISASSAFKVHIVPDTVYSTEVISDDNLVPYLAVTQSGGTVSLGLDPSHGYDGVTLMAVVHMPGLTGIDASGASQVKVDAGFSSTNPLAITASGASGVTFAGIAAGALTANVSGSSTLTASGTLSSEAVTASGGSKVDLIACTAVSASFSLSGGSEGRVDVGNGMITLSATGGSHLYHKGSPVFAISELSGGSELLQVN